MFDIGFSELVVIALVGLIVLGPKRLPEVARTAGQWVARFRRFVSDVKEDFDRELQHADLAELKKLKEELDETRRIMEETSHRLVQQGSLDLPHPVIPTPASPATVPPLTEPPAPASATSVASATTSTPMPPPLTEPPAAPKRARRTTKRPKKASNAGKNGDGRPE